MRKLWVLALLFPLPVSAANFCEDANLVVDTQFEWNFENGFLDTFPLPTHRQGQLFPTRTTLQLGAAAGSPELFGIYEFARKPNEVGLPYNLYRLQLQIGRDDEPDRQVIDQDYTDGCTGPGASLFPGGRLELNPVLLRVHSDGAPLGVETVHLRFWGK